MNAVVLDTKHLCATLAAGHGVPVYAFTGIIYESRLSYGHRIDFPIAHRFKFQMRELQSLLTSFVYSRASSNIEALAMLNEVRDSLLQDIRNNLSDAYALDDMAKFISENYLFVNAKTHCATIASNIIRFDYMFDVNLVGMLPKIYPILTQHESRYVAAIVSRSAKEIYNHDLEKRYVKN